MRNDKWFNPKLLEVAAPKVPRRHHKTRHGDEKKKPPKNHATGRPLQRKPAKSNPKAITRPGSGQSSTYRVDIGLFLKRFRPARGYKREAKRQKILAGMVE